LVGRTPWSAAGPGIDRREF